MEGRESQIIDFFTALGGYKSAGLHDCIEQLDLP